MISLPPPANDEGAPREPAGSRNGGRLAPERAALGMTRYPEVYIPHLTPDAQSAFKTFNPSAFWIGGNLDGEQPTRFGGDNQGAWPLRTGVTQQWRFDKGDKKLIDAYFARGLLLRYWCNFDTGHQISYRAANSLEYAFHKRVERHASPALSNFLSVEAGVLLSDLNLMVTDAASGLGIEVTSCRDLAGHLEAIARIGGGMGCG